MQKNAQTLPDFLVENNSLDLSLADIEKETAHRTLRRTLFFITTGWVVLLLCYLHFGLGWQNISALLPIEFAQFLALSVLPLLLALVLVAMVFKTSAVAEQARMTQKSLAKLLFNSEKNILSSVLDQELRTQISQINTTVGRLSEQTLNLKQEMQLKAEEFAKIGALLENDFISNIRNLSEGVSEFSKQCQEVAAVSDKATENLTLRVEEIKNSAQNASDILNPLINETIVSTERFQNILQANKDYIAQANADLNAFTQTNRQNLTQDVSVLNECQAKIEQSFLTTADRCGEIFKQLDSAVSYIETSLKNHKDLAEEQAALIHKNSSYLDNKLGEYGRLISLEVEEMIKRSDTLELNVKKQLADLHQAGEKTEKILNNVNNGLEQNSNRAVKNIEKIIANLEQEISKLSDFVKNTESKNNAIETTAEKISQKIGAISIDLGQQVDNLKNRSVEAIDKFNEVSGSVQKSALQLSETANIISTKGKENCASLTQQAAAAAETATNLENIRKYFSDISAALKQAENNAANLFSGYKSNVIEFNAVINRQLTDLAESRTLTEDHLHEIRQQYEKMDVTAFIDKSAEIIQNLNNISVDFNQFFNKENDEALWKKFYSGDYSVFARNVIKNMSRKQIVKIRTEYERNSDFRQMADRYISEFEILLESARKSERPQILMALLSGSELGKIYYIMGRALDRLN